MGDNWDDEDFDAAALNPVAGPVVNKWEGEDEEEDVKDNWDAEEAEEDGENKGAGGEAVAAKKKRRRLDEIIAEKEAKKAEELKRKQEALRVAQEAEDAKTKDPLQKKMEELRMQEESDLELAKAAFGLERAADSTTSPGVPSGPLENKEDFEAFRGQIAARLEPAQVALSPHFIPFVEDVLRDMVAVIGDMDDLKRISGTLSALYNEKLKASKALKGGKKKGKGKISIKGGKQDDVKDFGGYDVVEDYDDFM